MRGDSKLAWGLIIVFVSLLGPILYLAVGREEHDRAAPPSSLSWADQAVRRGARRAGRRRARPRRAGRLGLRPARAERRRQDDDAAAHDRARPADRRRRPRSTARRVDPRDRAGAGAAIGVLDQDPRYYGWMTGPRARRPRRPAAGPRARATPRTRAAETLELVGLADAADPPDRRLLGRDAPAARDRPGARRRPQAADPRRAGQLARPRGPARPPRAHRRAARRAPRSSSRPTSSPTSSGSATGSAILDRRPAGHRRAARRAARPIRAAALPARPGARAGRPLSRTCGPPCARSPWVDARDRARRAAAWSSVVRRRRAPRPGSCRSSSTPASGWPRSSGSGRSLEDVFLALVGRGRSSTDADAAVVTTVASCSARSCSSRGGRSACRSWPACSCSSG